MSHVFLLCSQFFRWHIWGTKPADSDAACGSWMMSAHCLSIKWSNDTPHTLLQGRKQIVSVDPQQHLYFSFPQQKFQEKESLVFEKPDIPTPSQNLFFFCSPVIAWFPSQASLSAPHSRLPHHFFILYRELRQLPPQSLVKVQIFGHTAVQTNRLTLCQFCLLVMWWYTLPVAGIGHPRRRGNGQVFRTFM